MCDLRGSQVYSPINELVLISVLIKFIEEVVSNAVDLNAVKNIYWNPMDILNPICHGLQGHLNG